MRIHAFNMTNAVINNYKALAVVVFVLAVGAVPTLAQTVQAQQTIEGFVTDEATGKPIGCKIYIFTAAGKKIAISSNSKDGSYLQTLSEAGPHKFVFQDYNVYRKEETVDIGATQKFKALKRNFTVKSVVENAPIFSVRGFDRNASTLTPEVKRRVDELAETLRGNQQMRAVLVVMPDEDQLGVLKANSEAEYLKAMVAWKKATKKIKKKQTPPPEPQRAIVSTDPNIALLQNRITALRTALKDVKNGDERITFESASLPSSATMASQAPIVVEPPAKGKKKKKAPKKGTVAPLVSSSYTSHATLTAKVGKVKRLFD